MVTTDPGTVLAILVADCVPIVLTDPQAGVLACVHAGWRGTVAGVTGAALHAMQVAGRPARSVIQAAIGPAVAADRYQVGAGGRRRPRSGSSAGTWMGSCTRTVPALRPGFLRHRFLGTGRWLFDLPAANRRVLREVRGARRPDPRQRAEHGQPGPGQQGHGQPRPGVVLQRPGGPPVRAVRGQSPALTAQGRITLSAAAPFRYDGYEIDPAAGLLTCRYSRRRLPASSERVTLYRRSRAAGTRRTVRAGRAAGVPAGRGVLLQDRRAGGHRPGQHSRSAAGSAASCASSTSRVWGSSPTVTGWT